MEFGKGTRRKLKTVPLPSESEEESSFESNLIKPSTLEVEFWKRTMSSYYSSDSDEGVEHAVSSGRTNTSLIVFNDMVHPHLKLPSICHKIINTPEFQRLRSLKQLGLTYHVYPSASHNRFEHCVGYLEPYLVWFWKETQKRPYFTERVEDHIHPLLLRNFLFERAFNYKRKWVYDVVSYLAGKYCRALQKNQPELGITEVDILCLNIAGLVHDIGHGPFSHTWEHFMHDTVPEYTHEVMSLRILDHMIERNGLWETFENNNLNEMDLIFIKEIILGHPLPDSNQEGFRGRGPEKYFLYQIVSNDETKIDVDKFDYLLRDSKQLNLTPAFDYERVIENTRVVRLGDGRMRIAYRKKITPCLEDLFKGRFRMHQMAYQHRVTKIIEEMVLDALRAADPYFLVSADDGTEYKLSTAYKDLSAFIKLTDVIFELMLNKWAPCGPTAWMIFNNIVTRNLYKLLGFIDHRPTDEAKAQLELTCPSVLLISSRINYGKGSENPLNAAWFYEKGRPNSVFHLDFLPAQTEEKYYIVLRPELNASGDVATTPTPADLNTSIASTTSSQSSEDFRSCKKLVKEWAAKNRLNIQME